MSTLETIERLYEQALIDITRATDARGLPILLMRWTPGTLPTAADFRETVHTLTQALGANTSFLGGAEAEQKYIHNLELLMRGWRYCLIYELLQVRRR